MKTIATVLFCFLILSCGGLKLKGYPKDFLPVTEQIQKGDWQAANEAFLEEYEEVLSDREDEDYLLALLEIGTLSHMNGNADEAIEYYLRADSIVDYMRDTEFTEELEAFLTSDLALQFTGADFEQVAINYQLAKCYYEEGMYRDALVECRRVNEKLQYYNSNYADDRKNRYATDAFIEYVTGAIYQSSGDMDDALVSYRSSFETYRGQYLERYKLEYPASLPNTIARLAQDMGHPAIAQEYLEMSGSEYTPIDSTCGEYLFLVEVGVIPPLYEKVFEEEGIEFRLPYMPVPEDTIPHSVQIEIRGYEGDVPVFLAQDYGRIARENIEDETQRHMLRCLASEVLRGLAKEAVSRIGQSFGLFGAIAGAVVNETLFDKDETDLRMWMTLPEQVFLARGAIPEGDYEVEIVVDDSLTAATSLTVDRGQLAMDFVRI